MRHYFVALTLLTGLTIFTGAANAAEPASADRSFRVAAASDDDKDKKDAKDKKDKKSNGDQNDRKGDRSDKNDNKDRPDRKEKADRPDKSDRKDNDQRNSAGGDKRQPFDDRAGGYRKDDNDSKNKPGKRDDKSADDKDRGSKDKKSSQKDDNSPPKNYVPPDKQPRRVGDDKRPPKPQDNDKGKDKGNDASKNYVAPDKQPRRVGDDKRPPKPQDDDKGKDKSKNYVAPDQQPRRVGDDKRPDKQDADKGRGDDRGKGDGKYKRVDGPRTGGRGAIDKVKRERRERVEDGGKRTIIEEPGNRFIVKDKDRPARIRHDEDDRFRRTSRNVRRERRPDGGNLTIALRPGGIEIYTEFDSSGRLMRRYRRDRNGREWGLIDNRRFRNEPAIIIGLAPPRFNLPRERYIVDYDRARDDDIYDALMDGPVERLDRGYSLDEIRYNSYLRDRMRRVDLDTVNFEFGAWDVPEDQYGRLERIAHIINRILDKQPDEVFLIEGHTDAVGSDIDNLTLSDRRAEEVAVILTETFNVPPENLVTQGYGEEFLKIPTDGPEIINRRVAVRRITPLLARGN